MRPVLTILEDGLIKQILSEAKRILSEIGIEVGGSALYGRLLDYGLRLDKKGERLLFPSDIIDKAIASTPKSFTLYNRSGEAFATLGGDNVHFVPGSSGFKSA